MCAILVYYSPLTGNQMLNTTTVDSHDPQFGDCFEKIVTVKPSKTEEDNFEGGSSFGGPLDPADCMP